MVRNVLGLIIGVVVAFLVVLGILSVNYVLFPIPANIDQTNMEQMSAYINQLPPTAFVVVLLAHFFGAMAGSWVASMIADSHQRTLSIGLSFFLLILGFVNMIQAPQPTWFIFADLMTYIPGGLIGYWIFKRKN